MITFGEVLEDIDYLVFTERKYALDEWVKLLIRINKMALSPDVFEEGASIEAVGNSCAEKKGRKFRDILSRLEEFLIENDIQIRHDLGAFRLI